MKFISGPFSKYILLAAILYMPLFGHLGSKPIRLWDESRLFMNAYEMIQDHDILVTHFEGQPDMWNTKPPLLIWMQVLSMKLFGLNETAFRIPSALAALFTCILLLWFSVRYLEKPWLGIISAIILMTSTGYVQDHVSRTGDYDCLLTFFLFFSCLHFYLFTESGHKKNLYLFFAGTTLAILTKGVAGFFFVPSLAIYTIIRRKTGMLVLNRHFYAGLSGLALVIAGYYLLRESQNPGYLSAVFQNELGNRFLNTIENHQGDFWFYYDALTGESFAPWYVLIPAGILCVFFMKDQRLKRISLLLVILMVVYFVLISLAQTKIIWYAAPLYPVISMLAGIVIYFVFQFLTENRQLQQSFSYNIIPGIFLYFIFITPIQKITMATYDPQELPAEKEYYEISYYLREALHGKQNMNQVYILFDGVNTHLMPYILRLREKGIVTGFADIKNPPVHTTVITNQESIKNLIASEYNTVILDYWGNIIRYRIESHK